MLGESLKATVRRLVNRARLHGLIMDIERTGFECEYCNLFLLGLVVRKEKTYEIVDQIPLLCTSCAKPEDIDRAFRVIKEYARSEEEYDRLTNILYAEVDRERIREWLSTENES